jgi:uncharacterized SAM-binding protein YcdF (DUF218 family)
MFYTLSKVVWFLATPSNLLPLMGILGAALAIAGIARGFGLALAALAPALLLVAGLSPLPNLLAIPLEERFPTYRHGSGPVDGVIVLGGAANGDDSEARGQLIVNEAGERILALIELAKRYPEAKLVFSGGGSTFLENESPESEAVARFGEAVGIPRERLIIETRSRTTAENASQTKALVTPRPGERWLLVTSAWHMPRSVGCFRAVGFEVIPYPVDYRTRGAEDARRGFLYASEGLRRLDLMAKEWVGLVAYRLTGRTDALFPGPRPLAQVSSGSGGPIR